MGAGRDKGRRTDDIHHHHLLPRLHHQNHRHHRRLALPAFLHAHQLRAHLHHACPALGYLSPPGRSPAAPLSYLTLISAAPHTHYHMQHAFPTSPALFTSCSTRLLDAFINKGAYCSGGRLVRWRCSLYVDLRLWCARSARQHASVIPTTALVAYLLCGNTAWNRHKMSSSRHAYLHLFMLRAARTAAY